MVLRISLPRMLRLALRALGVASYLLLFGLCVGMHRQRVEEQDIQALRLIENDVIRRVSILTGKVTTTLAVLARNVFCFALRVEGADAALQEQISAFAAGQFALGTNVTSHFSLSPITRDAFSAGGSRCAGSGLRR